MTFDNREIVRPRLELLNPEQINTLHLSSLKILEETGIKVESPKALKIFNNSGGVIVKGDVAYIQRDLVSQAIKRSPSNIKIFDRNGDHAFDLGEKQGSETYFGIGVTNTNFQNIERGSVEPFKRKHMQHSAKLGDMLANYDMVSTLGIPSDVPVERLDLFSTLDMYANTSKPLVLLISEGNNIDHVFELLSHLHGDISQKPFCIPYLNPVTPLILNESTTDKMIASINSRLPIIYSNYSMYGGSSPMTEGGTLALLNAELLAGLVFSQLVREGAEIILGSLPAAFNMKTMGSQYTPTSYLLNLACAEMMDHYQIPHCGTSGSGNGWGADISSAGDLWLNHLTSLIGKIGCAPFVGGNFDSMAFSPSTAILSNQIIGEAKKFAKGFLLNDETINIADIDVVGHGGDYFISEATLASLSNIEEADAIWPSLDLNSWKAKGMPKAEDSLIEYSIDLYSKAMKASEENVDIIKKGETYINKISK